MPTRKCDLVRSAAPFVALLCVRSLLGQAPATLSSLDVGRETRAFTALLGARYMEDSRSNPSAACRDTVYEGWTGFPVRLCTYSVHDGQLGELRASVVLLDADPEKLARWVVSACLEVMQTAAVSCTGKLRDRIVEQSGAQFPVAGLVLENMQRRDRWTMFAFRDGVTCVVDGVENGSHTPVKPHHVQQALAAPVARERVYGRIAGTTQADYDKYLKSRGRPRDAYRGSNASWRHIVRELYQKAWSSDRNELLVAWAFVHLKHTDN